MKRLPRSAIVKGHARVKFGDHVKFERDGETVVGLVLAIMSETVLRVSFYSSRDRECEECTISTLTAERTSECCG